MCEVNQPMKLRPSIIATTALLFLLSLGIANPVTAQIPKPAAAYPAHLPYTFSNFVWWSDNDLRALLKKRIPGLGDEVATKTAAEGKLRDALTALMKEKGIVAEVQSNEPSDFALKAERAPGSPEPSIVFSILTPQVLIERVTVSSALENLPGSLQEDLQRKVAGHEYSSGQDWLVRSNCEHELQAKGYLEPKITISHDAPRKDSNLYLVNLLISVDAGAQFHISGITADGGPLLKGRDLSQYFTERVGDLAGVGPFGRLVGELRSVYLHYGYAGVEIHGPPVLDRERALVSYHLEVTPGPVYLLRNLTIHKLDAAQESKARELLGMKPGEVFDDLAIDRLYQKIRAEPSLSGYSFTFSPAKDPAAARVDLTLDFYKVSDASSVTIK